MLSTLGFLEGASRRKPRPFLAGIRAFVAVLLALLVLPLAARAADTPMTLEGGISATLNMPDSTEPVPAVLLLHGFGSSKDEVGGMYARVATALAQKGIASLRIDFAGFGKSGGAHQHRTVSRGDTDRNPRIARYEDVSLLHRSLDAFVRAG